MFKRVTIEMVKKAIINLEAGTFTQAEHIHSKSVIRDYMSNNCYSEISRAIYLYIVATDEKRYQDATKIARAIVDFITVLE